MVNQRLYGCPTCGSVVGENDRRRHITWHDQLKQTLEQEVELGDIDGVQLHEFTPDEFPVS